MPQRTKSGVHVLGFGGEDEFLQPVLQAEVVGDAAEQAHGGVGVGVDQAGRKDGFGPVEALLRLELRVDLRLRADPRDVVAHDGDGAVFDHAPRGVHGDDVARAPDPIGGRGRQAEGE